MSDRPYFHEPNHTIHLRVWALGQMVWGAFLAGVFLMVVAGFLIAIWIVGLLLPEQSKQAPSPFSAIVIESPERSA